MLISMSAYENDYDEDDDDDDDDEQQVQLTSINSSITRKTFHVY
jgi:hypothetical protein